MHSPTARSLLADLLSVAPISGFLTSPPGGEASEPQSEIDAASACRIHWDGIVLIFNSDFVDRDWGDRSRLTDFCRDGRCLAPLDRPALGHVVPQHWDRSWDFLLAFEP